MANLVPGLLRRMFDGTEAETDMQVACAVIDGIPMMKAVLASQPIWRGMRPPLRTADEATALQAANLLSRLEDQAPACLKSFACTPVCISGRARVRCG